MAFPLRIINQESFRVGKNKPLFYKVKGKVGDENLTLKYFLRQVSFCAGMRLSDGSGI